MNTTCRYIFALLPEHNCR